MAQTNLAFYYVAGPAHIYVRFPSIGAGPYVPPSSLAGTINFLGHCEESPEPDFIPHYLPVHSSLAGPAIPDDEVDAGVETKLGLMLSRFNYTIAARIQQAARHGRGAPLGTETYLDRGRLLMAQGDSFELWIKNSFYGTANAAAYPDLPPGYYFPAVRAEGVLPRKINRETKQMHISLFPKSVRLGVVGGFMTYSQDPKWFAKLPDPG